MPVPHDVRDGEPARNAWAFLLSPLVIGGAWAGFVLAAVVMHAPWNGHSFDRESDFEELVAFAAAFASAGSIATIAAATASETWKRGLAAAFVIASLLPLPALEVLRRVEFGKRMIWGMGLRDTAMLGGGLGVVPGIVMAGLVAAFIGLTRKRISWKIGLAAAVLTVAALSWIVPALVFVGYRDFVTPIARSRDWSEASAVGGLIGGLLGAIGGAVLGAMTARWVTASAPGLPHSPSTTEQTTSISR